MSSPTIGSPAYNDESLAWKLVNTDLVTVIVRFLSVSGRMYTKCFITRARGWRTVGFCYLTFALFGANRVHGIGSSVLALLIAVARVVRGSLTGLLHRYVASRHISI